MQLQKLMDLGSHSLNRKPKKYNSHSHAACSIKKKKKKAGWYIDK